MERSKYKPGDKVRVRKDLKEGKSYLCENGTILEYPEAWYCNDSMAARAGSVMTIKEVKEVKDNYRCVYYRLVEDYENWGWSADMFDGLADDSAPERWEPPEAEAESPFKEPWEELF